jgi:hypothetical protein
VTAFAVPLSIICANVIIAANSIQNTNEGTGLRLVLAAVCAATPALVLFGAPVPALWWGWLLGGALFAVDNTISLSNRGDYPLTGPIVQWLLLAALLVVVLVAARLTAPRGRPAEPHRT